jgi:hypothetical protein
MPVDSTTVRLLVEVELPVTLLRAFLEDVREFESRSPNDIHIAMVLNSPALAVKEIGEILRELDPPV